ncbi:hypothetical protein ACFL20_02220, partial [Spirochaetota bacterium]
MSKMMESILNRYEDSSYELQGKARTLIYFLLVFVPAQMVFLIVLNVTAKRSIFDAANMAISFFIILCILCSILIYFGYYYISATMLCIILMVGMFYINFSTIKSGSSARFVGSLIPNLPLVVICILFTKRYIYYPIILLSTIGISINIFVLSKGLLTKTETGSAIGTIIFSIVIVSSLCILILRVYSSARNRRMEENLEKREKNIEIYRTLIKSLKEISEKMDDSSNQLSDSSDSFSANIQSQAASIEEVTASIEEILSNSENVKNHVEDQTNSMSDLIRDMSDLTDFIMDVDKLVNIALDKTGNISVQAKSGGQYINEMNESMVKINSTSLEMANILNIINDISDQINLLSLN